MSMRWCMRPWPRTSLLLKRLRSAVPTASDPEDAPVEPLQDKAGHRTRRVPRPCPSTLPSYEQARAIAALLLLKNAAPDEPPTPRAGAP